MADSQFIEMLDLLFTLPIAPAIELEAVAAILASEVIQDEKLLVTVDGYEGSMAAIAVFVAYMSAWSKSSQNVFTKVRLYMNESPRQEELGPELERLEIKHVSELSSASEDETALLVVDGVDNIEPAALAVLQRERYVVALLS